MAVLQAGCRLDQAQAEAIAVVAQEFQEGQTRVLQQRTECAAALRQASPQLGAADCTMHAPCMPVLQFRNELYACPGLLGP